MNAIDTAVKTQPQWLSNFIDIYQSLNTENVKLIEKIYHPEVVFEDPLHRVEGRDSLLQYFEQLYLNLSQCDFTIDRYFVDGNNAAIYWNMEFCHSKLNGGRSINVSGHTHIRGRHDKVIYHRDYLDAGAMLYEHIPLLGGAVRFIKRRASR